MKRILLFIALVAVFMVWAFPHRSVVERIVTDRLSPLGVDVSFGDVAFSWWPVGYRVEDVTVARPPYALRLESLYVSIHWDGAMHFDADGCGGTIRGSLRHSGSGDEEQSEDGRVLDLVFDELDPSTCMELAGLSVEGTFGGQLTLGALGRGDAAGLLGQTACSGHLSLEGRAGKLAGTLPARRLETGRPIGEWEFESAVLEADVRNGQLLIEDSSARAERVEWVIAKARVVPNGASAPRIAADLRARRLDDSPRARAILGLMPKASESSGWRRYRISGTISDPHVIGLR